MSLVAYDSSDGSEDENTSKPNLPSNLLKPLVKNQKGNVKITIPSLKEFEDDEEEVAVVKKPKIQSGTGLFSLLPPPKNTSTLNKPGFVPHVLKSKKESPKVTPKQNKNCHVDTKFPLATASILSVEQDSDEDNFSVTNKSNEDSTNAATKNDFFWLDDLASNNKSEEGNINKFSFPSKNETFIHSLPSSSSRIPEFPEQETKNVYKLSETDLIQTSSIEVDKPDSYSSQSYLATEPASEDTKNSLLTDKEFLKLQGRRRDCEEINIIDVSVDDQLTDKSQWLMKNLTEESTIRPSRKRHAMPTQQQKRKHQITYLAFQAKEREMDLKKQWSLNSSTRRETQAKYGF